jgi:hypothetical protein
LAEEFSLVHLVLRCNSSFPDYAIFKDQLPHIPKDTQRKLPLRYIETTQWSQFRV